MPTTFKKGLGAELQERIKERAINGPRKPLRTFKEMCAELKMDARSLKGLMSVYHAPKPVINGMNNRHKTMWYNHDEFRAWWKKTKAKIAASNDPSSPKKTYPRKPKERKLTMAFAMQQWLREHGPATVKQIREAGFTGVYGGASQRMMALGALRKEGTGRSVLWIATDVDYIPPRKRKEPQ